MRLRSEARRCEWKKKTRQKSMRKGKKWCLQRGHRSLVLFRSILFAHHSHIASSEFGSPFICIRLSLWLTRVAFCHFVCKSEKTFETLNDGWMDGFVQGIRVRATMSTYLNKYLSDFWLCRFCVWWIWRMRCDLCARTTYDVCRMRITIFACFVCGYWIVDTNERLTSEMKRTTQNSGE